MRQLDPGVNTRAQAWQNLPQLDSGGTAVPNQTWFMSEKQHAYVVLQGSSRGSMVKEETNAEVETKKNVPSSG